MNQENLQKIEKRTVSYWFEDGAYDIVIGIGFVILGISYFALAAVQEIDWLENLSGLIQIVLLVTIFFLLGKVVRKIKQSVVYPRTGEVVYRQRPPSIRFMRSIRAGVMSFLVAAVFTFFALAPSMHQVLSAIVGALFGVAFMILGWRVGVVRYFIIGAGSFISGGIISLLSHPFINQTGILFVAIGLIMAVAGGVALVLYLKNNPLESDRQEQE